MYLRICFDLELYEKYLRGRSPILRQVGDIHAVCGLLKHFLRQMREPLVTHARWRQLVDLSTEWARDQLSNTGWGDRGKCAALLFQYK